MSLTGFLKQSQEARTLLQEHFPYPRSRVIFPPLRCSPLTKNYAIVGQGFDYLLRFYMQRHNPHTPKKAAWVANFITATIVGESSAIQHQRDMERAALPFLELAHDHHKRYLEDGQVTDDLLGSCLNLAIIDGLVRAGEMRGLLGGIDQRDRQDLRNLLAAVPSSPFLDGNPCVLNPTFAFPGGADCDLLIGNTLIEIKTTKFAELKLEYYQQLLGYCLLNFNDTRSPYPIEQIGVYFLRHGYLWTVALEDIASRKVFQRVLPLWNEFVKGRNLV